MKTEPHDPAHPLPFAFAPDGSVVYGFPSGMTKREQIAMSIMAGMMASDRAYTPELVATRAVQCADALITELNRPPAPEEPKWPTALQRL